MYHPSLISLISKKQLFGNGKFIFNAIGYIPSYYSPYSTNKSNYNYSPLLKPIKPNDNFISSTCFNEKGIITSVSKKFPKWSFLRDFDLYPRDLRKIDSSSVDIIPSILVKKKCIIINILYIKVLIAKDKLYIFDTSTAKDVSKLGVLMYDLESKLSQKHSQPSSVAKNITPDTTTLSSDPNTNQDKCAIENTSFNLNGNLNSTYNFNNSLSNHQSYEHKALESILINVMGSLETELKMHSTVSKQLLLGLENEVNRDKLRDLLIKSKDLSLFYQKSLLIRDVLDELLENDEDMAGMYLTNPIKPNQDIADFDFADLEMLLETYYTQCDEYVQQAESLIQDIKSTEEIVNIILDANRNSLMLLELKITIYTLGFSVATLLPAFYGMNLKNFIEESNFGFSGIVSISIIMGIYVTRKNFAALRSTTRLTMLNNHMGNLSPKHTSIANENTQKYVPTLWLNCTKAWERFWWGRSLRKRERVLKTRENREKIWKWLLEKDPK
ncbi:hypothetical protein TBLA_0E01870 [Henningerozyma blattae CBS 6284]|uniref:Magnesium transporter n=1 Tax=Henningerozyma blattae (strain ATCC 34711 / CBS 6284 / DSM 70876 / NBRC 10599 / NRRL Y-10934 / UCD 77-7) TaxID=1071380 RepID=I2H4D9_HENB6|nr:hypothetical protein TBLA_0E01870 [Tetrapisispora blattae CBS 6284]CCH61241.1 hypothetical protein TBLA_0E01870 [Tetrapisispora blattae CBS 6284]